MYKFGVFKNITVKLMTIVCTSWLQLQKLKYNARNRKYIKKKVNIMKSLFHQGIVLLSTTIFDSEWDICKIKSTPHQA
jgi:hypothetical protein